MRGSAFRPILAWTGAIITATTLGAAAQPCVSSGDGDGSGLYPLPKGAGWGFVGADGEWRLAPEWRQVRPFSEGVAAVETDAGWGLIDRAGQHVVAPGAQDADRVVISGRAHALSPYKPMSQGCSAATPADGPAHYVTADGDRWMPPALSKEAVIDLGSFSEGLAWARVKRGENAPVGWIDTDGAWAIAPDDPLINFFTPARATEDGDRLGLSLGEFGPKLEWGFPAGYAGAFTAGPEAPVSITFAGVPVSAEGRLARAKGGLSGNVTAKLGAHDQVDGPGSVTLRFAGIPVEGGE